MMELNLFSITSHFKQSFLPHLLNYTIIIIFNTPSMLVLGRVVKLREHLWKIS